MANVLVYIELKEREAREASLCALNVGRAIASGVGATLYALVPSAAPPSYGDNDIIAVLSRNGADKVILVTHPELDETPLHATHGDAVKAACMQFHPRLVLMAATTAARDLAPRLAVQLGGHYVADAEVEPAAEAGDFRLVSCVFRRRFRQSESLCSISGPVVATLVPRGAPRAVGDDEAEVVMLQSPARDARSPRIQARRPAPQTDRVAARLVVAGGAGLQREGFERLRRLAVALGGAPIASDRARASQLADEDLQAGGLLAAELYLTFGVSGSERHLARLGPATRIIAVNTDAAAPIGAVAQQLVQADADQTLKELLAELEGGG